MRGISNLTSFGKIGEFGVFVLVGKVFWKYCERLRYFPLFEFFFNERQINSLNFWKFGEFGGFFGWKTTVEILWEVWIFLVG